MNDALTIKKDNSNHVFYSTNIYMSKLFNEMPELAHKIFSYLLDAQSLSKMREICQSWKVLAGDDILWKVMFIKPRGLQYEIRETCGIAVRKQFRSILDKRKKLYKKVERNCGISLGETHTVTWAKDKNMKTILASDYLNPAIKPGMRAPIQITYKDGFEYIINKKNYMIDLTKKFLLEELKKTNEESISQMIKDIPLYNDSDYDPIISALTNIELKDHDGINFEFLRKRSGSNYASWLDLICFLLENHDVIDFIETKRCQFIFQATISVYRSSLSNQKTQS